MSSAKRVKEGGGDKPVPTNAREVAEQALAHTIGNKVEAAYLRSDLFEKRRHLMNLWATYLDTPKGQVIDFNDRRELA